MRDLPRKLTVEELADLFQARSRFVEALAEVVASTEDTMRACTELYGGPETAHLTGTLEGEPVDVTITRNNGCGIADYDLRQ